MQYEIKTRQGESWRVSDDDTWLWVRLERELGLTLTQAAEKMQAGSLDVISWVLWTAAADAGFKVPPTQADFVRLTLDSFEVVEEDPKSPAEASPDN